MSVQTHRLKNGFRIVTEHMPGLHSASVGIWVKAGCRHERADQNGIAHFLEHMAFKGTAKRTSLEIAEAVENVGGYINAYTSREVTAFYARVLKNDVGLALDVLADIVQNPVFDPREIDVERGVILQEIGQALDTPDDIIFDWLQETAFPDQPMGRSILGPAERVRAFGKDDFQDFVRHNYRPSEMILSAAGAVDHDALVAQAEDLFGGMDTGQQGPQVAATYKGGELRETKDLEQAHFAFALPAPGYRDDDIYVAQIHAIALGGGMSSRLFQEVREKRGLCYSIFAQSGAFDDSGLLTIYAGTGVGELEELSHLVIDELRRVGDDLSQEEIDRARAQMKAGLLMGLESPSSRAERLARMIAIWDRVPPLDETIARIDAVNLSDTRDFANNLRSSDPTLALYGPVDAAPGHEALAERLAS